MVALRPSVPPYFIHLFYLFLCSKSPHPHPTKPCTQKISVNYVCALAPLVLNFFKKIYAKINLVRISFFSLVLKKVQISLLKNMIIIITRNEIIH